jgi:hypothetical protein
MELPYGALPTIPSTQPTKKFHPTFIVCLLEKAVLENMAEFHSGSTSPFTKKPISQSEPWQILQLPLSFAANSSSSHGQQIDPRCCHAVFVQHDRSRRSYFRRWTDEATLRPTD